MTVRSLCFLLCRCFRTGDIPGSWAGGERPHPPALVIPDHAPGLHFSPRQTAPSLARETANTVRVKGSYIDEAFMACAAL
jgi:hypothetical protein